MSDGRTIVGFDGTASAWRALDWAVEAELRQAQAHVKVLYPASPPNWLGAGIEAVHAWDVAEVFQRALDEGQTLDKDFLRREQEVIPEAIADVPIAREASITPSTVRRNPATALIERGRGAALVVVGTRGRGRFAAAMLGSVSHDLLLDLPCPVLVTSKEYSFVVPGDGSDEV